MIKSKFTFFQVQSKGTFADASKLIEPPFGDGPKVLNAVNVITSIGKFIVSMFDPIVLFVTEVYQAVIGLKSVRIDHRVQIDLLPYYGHQSALRAISDNLCIHLATSFDQPKNDMFTTGAAAADPTNSSGTKVAFVDLNFTGIIPITSRDRNEFTQYFSIKVPQF